MIFFALNSKLIVLQKKSGPSRELRDQALGCGIWPYTLVPYVRKKVKKEMPSNKFSTNKKKLTYAIWEYLGR
jgi:hypothetical protein